MEYRVLGRTGVRVSAVALGTANFADPTPEDEAKQILERAVCRGFRNISDEEGILQVLITGGIHDMQDIAFPPGVADELDSVQSGLADFFRSTGLAFNAGLE